MVLENNGELGVSLIENKKKERSLERSLEATSLAYKKGISEDSSATRIARRGGGVMVL